MLQGISYDNHDQWVQQILGGKYIYIHIYEEYLVSLEKTCVFK